MSQVGVADWNNGRSVGEETVKFHAVADGQTLSVPEVNVIYEKRLRIPWARGQRELHHADRGH